MLPMFDSFRVLTDWGFVNFQMWFLIFFCCLLWLCRWPLTQLSTANFFLFIAAYNCLRLSLPRLTPNLRPVASYDTVLLYIVVQFLLLMIYMVINTPISNYYFFFLLFITYYLWPLIDIYAWLWLLVSITTLNMFN